LSLFKPKIMITENLVFENKQGDYLISLRNTDSLRKLVEFTELTDYIYEADWGQIRLFKSKMDESIVLQFRGRTDTIGEKKGLVATSRLKLSDLQEIVRVAAELCGEVQTSECDSLRAQVQELQAKVDSLTIDLREAENSLHLLEG
jgi:hypothetical protein